MNLDPFERNNDDEIWRAIEHSSLKPFVNTLPEKLEFIVTEGGENMRQVFLPSVLNK